MLRAKLGSTLARIVTGALLLVQPSHTQADLGNPTIQAICRISLTNGTSLEGVIETAGGGYSRYLNTHGILLIGEDTDDPLGGFPVFFDFAFQSLTPGVGEVRSPRGTRLRPGKNIVKAYYLHDCTEDDYYIDDVKYTMTVDTAPSGVKLRRDVLTRAVYELRDSLPLFLSVPRELHVSYAPSVHPHMISLSDIQKIELLREPDSTWGQQIKDMTNLWMQDHAEESGDYTVPEWFHDILRDVDSFQFKDRFRPWRF